MAVVEAAIAALRQCCIPLAVAVAFEHVVLVPGVWVPADVGAAALGGILDRLEQERRLASGTRCDVDGAIMQRWQVSVLVVDALVASPGDPSRQRIVGLECGRRRRRRRWRRLPVVRRRRRRRRHQTAHARVCELDGAGGHLNPVAPQPAADLVPRRFLCGDLVGDTQLLRCLARHHGEHVAVAAAFKPHRDVVCAGGSGRHRESGLVAVREAREVAGRSEVRRRVNLPKGDGGGAEIRVAPVFRVGAGRVDVLDLDAVVGDGRPRRRRRRRRQRWRLRGRRRWRRRRRRWRRQRRRRRRRRQREANLRAPVAGGGAVHRRLLRRVDVRGHRRARRGEEDADRLVARIRHEHEDLARDLRRHGAVEEHAVLTADVAAVADGGAGVGADARPGGAVDSPDAVRVLVDLAHHHEYHVVQRHAALLAHQPTGGVLRGGRDAVEG